MEQSIGFATVAWPELPAVDLIKTSRFPLPGAARKGPSFVNFALRASPYSELAGPEVEPPVAPTAQQIAERRVDRVKAKLGVLAEERRGAKRARCAQDERCSCKRSGERGPVLGVNCGQR